MSTDWYKYKYERGESLYLAVDKVMADDDDDDKGVLKTSCDCKRVLS